MAAWVIALSAQVDHELSLMLVRVIGAHVRPALAMFDELDSQRAQLRLLTAAARAELGPDSEQYRVFRAVLKVAETAQVDRHRLAHWIWGSCPELPDALLLADPKAVRTQTIELARAKDKVKPTWLYTLGTDDEEKHQDQLAISKLHAPNRDAILVYLDSDLNRAIRDLGEALQALHHFPYFLRPLDISDPPPELADLGTTEGALRRLNSLRLFREAYGPASGSNDPNNTPQSQP